jgi:hypothetical protein
MQSLSPGARFAVTLDGTDRGEVELTGDQRLRGLISHLRRVGVQPGQMFLVEFDVKTLQIALKRLDSDVRETEEVHRQPTSDGEE